MRPSGSASAKTGLRIFGCKIYTCVYFLLNIRSVKQWRFAPATQVKKKEKNGGSRGRVIFYEYLLLCLAILLIECYFLGPENFLSLQCAIPLTTLYFQCNNHTDCFVDIKKDNTP